MGIAMLNDKVRELKSYRSTRVHNRDLMAFCSLCESANISYTVYQTERDRRRNNLIMTVELD